MAPIPRVIVLFPGASPAFCGITTPTVPKDLLPGESMVVPFTGFSRSMAVLTSCRRFIKEHHLTPLMLTPLSCNVGSSKGTCLFSTTLKSRSRCLERSESVPPPTHHRAGRHCWLRAGGNPESIRYSPQPVAVGRSCQACFSFGRRYKTSKWNT